MTEGNSVAVISALLQLTDTQQQQFRTAFDATLRAAIPIATQLQDSKTALFEAVKSGKSDDEIKNLADKQGALTSQILALQAQTFAKLWAILNAQQRTQVDDFIYTNIGAVLTNPNQSATPAPTAAPAGPPPPAT